MNNPVKYQKWFFDNRINKPGHWAGLSIYEHSEMWNIKKRYYKTPFFFLSYSPWGINIGICIGKTAYTVQYHHYKPMWGNKKKKR